MSSKPGSERTWSLTRRMALLFALTTGTLLALYGIWSGYFLVEALRDEAHGFLTHELDELGLNLRQSDGSPEAVRQCAENIARVSEEPPAAFRVRDARGAVVAESGPGWLLAKHPGPLDHGVSWRAFLFSREIIVASRAMNKYALGMEVIADAKAVVATVKRGLLSLFLTLLGGLALAGVAGWLTAHFGLRGVREVVARAHDIHGVSDAGPIELKSAPRELKELGQALNEMLSRIRRGLVDMRTFTAGLAHELRSPIQNLLGETEVALLRDREPEAYRKTLHSNLEDIHALADAVDNLVAYCQTSEPGRRDQNAESFDLAEEARLRLARERRSAERDGVRVEIASEGDARLRADREGCLRVLRNLVGNAIAWSPADGVVSVQIVGQPNRVRVVVEDRGPGVPPALVERIFEPFVSGRPGKGRRGGYGLGLAICKTVLDDHGGTVRYEPREGGGARFVAEFPRAA